MEKKIFCRISGVSEIRETSRGTIKISTTVESHKYSFTDSHQCSSNMEKSNEELAHIRTNSSIAEQAIYGPNNNPYPQYFVNDAQYSQSLPAAASNLNTYGRVNYVDRQHFVVHDRALSPATNSLNPYGRFAIPLAGPGIVRNELGYQIIPAQSHNYGFGGCIDHHGRHRPFAPNNFSGQSLHERVMVPVPNDVNPHGRGRFPTPSPFNISSPYILHGPGFVRNELGYVNNEGPSQIYPAASSGYSFVGNDGRISCTDPQLASFTVNTAQAGLGHISQPAVNSMNSIGGNSEVTVSTDRSSVADTNFLNNQRLKLIHKIILFYKANTTLYDKHPTAFDKKDWLSLAYTNDGSLKADMYCPVCLSGINPIYRKTGSWEFTNMKRHFSHVHPDDVKIKPTTAKAAKKTPTVEVPEDDYIKENNKTLLEQEGAKVENSKTEQNETSTDSKGTKAGINKQNKASEVVAEMDSLDIELSSGKEDSEHDSNVDSSCMDLPTKCSTSSSNDKVTMQERNKRNSRNKSRFNMTTSKYELEKRNTRKNGQAGVAGQNEAKRKKRKDLSTSTDSSKSVDLNSGTRKRMKYVKRSTSDKSKQKETKGKHCKGLSCVGTKKKKQNNRVESTSSSSESEADEIAVNNNQLIPEAWRGNGVEYSWVKFSQRGKCYPGFIFPELDAEGKKSAQYLTMKGELSDVKHPIQCKVDYEDLPRKYHELYAKAFQTFNRKTIQITNKFTENPIIG